jgi:hypothetical protein
MQDLSAPASLALYAAERPFDQEAKYQEILTALASELLQKILTAARRRTISTRPIGRNAGYNGIRIGGMLEGVASVDERSDIRK